MLGKKERLAEFVRRMIAAPRVSSAEEAMELLSDTLNQVEDELTAIPFAPDRWRDDGRIYPPQSDSARAVPGRPDVTRYRHVNHDTFIGANGAIRIVECDTGGIVLEKRGENGCGIDPTK